MSVQKITAKEFARRYGFSDRDIFSVSKTYAKLLYTEQEWSSILKNQYEFVFAQKEKAKNEKQSDKNK